MEKKLIKIVEWNINQRTNKYDKNKIPNWIKDELVKYQKADIIVLTEFFKTENWEEIVSGLSEYNVFVTDNSKNHQSDVLIAIKKKLRIVNIKDIQSTLQNNNPNFLRVDTEINDKLVSIIGVRIRIESIKRKDYKSDNEYYEAFEKEKKNRRDQNSIILRHVCHIKNPVVIMGDFNNFKREYEDKVWCLKEVKKLYEHNNFTLNDVKGSSIFQEKYSNEGSECAEDHIITKGLTAYDQEYTRDFMSRTGREDIYHEKKDFENIKSPYPDHAILNAKLKLL